MYLMISTYLVPLADVDAARDEHLEFVGELEKQGYAVSAGRQDPPVGGVILLDVDTEDEARELIARDPYVRQGLAEYQPVGWRPARGVLAGWTRQRG